MLKKNNKFLTDFNRKETDFFPGAKGVNVDSFGAQQKKLTTITGNRLIAGLFSCKGLSTYK